MVLSHDQWVERAELMLSKTDLVIADIALQVGFQSKPFDATV